MYTKIADLTNDLQNVLQSYDKPTQISPPRGGTLIFKAND